MTRSRVPLLTIFASLALIQGCVTGIVRDAATRSPIDGARVIIEGVCNGPGCQNDTTGSASTGTDGRFIFDAYGGVSGDDHVQGLDVAPGGETMTVTIHKDGYQDRTLYFRPQYQKVTSDDGSQTFDVASVPDVFLCAVGSTDTDSDGLCDDAEAAYGSKVDADDTDRDGFSDLAEIAGFDRIDLRSYGASPSQRDVFVYIDYYVAPISEGLARVEQAFAAAPADAPGGSAGIALHLMMGQQIAPNHQNQNLIGISKGD
jgi:hypothetical protein